MKTYNKNEVIKINRKIFLNYIKSFHHHCCKLFGVDEETFNKKWNENKNKHKKDYDNLFKNGYDVGTITACYIKVKNMVLYHKELYILSTDNILYKF